MNESTITRCFPIDSIKYVFTRAIVYVIINQANNKIGGAVF